MFSLRAQGLQSLFREGVDALSRVGKLEMILPLSLTGFKTHASTRQGQWYIRLRQISSWLDRDGVIKPSLMA